MAGMEGCVRTGELVAMFCLTDVVSVSLNDGVTRLPIGKAGCSEPGSIDWKLLDALEGIICEMFLYLFSVSNSKWEGSDFGLIMDHVLLRMEPSGNLIQ